jgi:hypothetical protein
MCVHKHPCLKQYVFPLTSADTTETIIRIGKYVERTLATNLGFVVIAIRNSTFNLCLCDKFCRVYCKIIVDTSIAGPTLPRWLSLIPSEKGLREDLVRCSSHRQGPLTQC